MRAAALDQIRGFADTGDGALGLLARADEAVIRALPADQSSWQVYDPHAMLPVGFYSNQPAPFEERLVHCQIEQGGADINLFRDLARRSVPVATLEAATHGNPDRSLRYQELLRPAGFRHEVRAALVHRGTCWGAPTLVRSGSKGFTAMELRWLATVSHVVAADLSRRMAVRAGDSATPGPGVLLLRPGGEQVCLNPQAGYWLDALSEPPWGADRASAALQGGVMRSIGQGPSRPVHLHLPTQVGWAAAHVSVTAQSDWATVVIDLARPSQVIPLLAAAYGLTATEQAVTGLILRGMSAKEAARQLRVSSGTINDHLKSIYAKTGTSSRGQLQHLFALDAALPHTRSLK